jgi:Fe(3+) dicitrate transport protein
MFKPLSLIFAVALCVITLKANSLPEGPKGDPIGLNPAAIVTATSDSPHGSPLKSIRNRSVNGSVHGIVTDQDNQPLPHVNIGFVGTRHGTSTCAEGKFVIEGVSPGLYILSATMIGFEDYRQEFQVKAGESKQVEVTMPERVYQMEQVSIIAERRGIFERIPGSLSYIDQQQIARLNPVSGNEVFRRSPGVHVVDEEGLGLRVNIGIRGLDPDRSRSVLIMEDGIPVSLAPYGEPEMYYTPAMDRMAGVEILKGSGSILYGPQTIGGVINYITADPPLEPTGSFSVRGAEGGFFNALFSYGNTFENTGYQVNFLRKQADSVGVVNYLINDFTARARTQLGDKSSLSMKLGVYDEGSNSTYVGITQTMYDAGGPFDFVRIAPDDKLDIRRYSMSLTHNRFFGEKTRLTTMAYGYTTKRNWQRQDFTYSSFDANGSPQPAPLNFNGIVWGDESVPGGAIYMRNSTGNRNRQFEVAGVESRFHANGMAAGLQHEFTAGARLLYERAYEQRVNGQQGNASSGNLQDDEIRTGYGSSVYLHNQVNLSHRLSVTAGLRAEHFQYERDIRRGRFLVNGQSQIRDTLLVAGSSLLEIIPGAGFNYSLGSASTLFGGVHRGFAPPRIKDAVANDGYVYELDAEKSWNYELGMRQKTGLGISFELTAFYMDFSNQVIPVAESAGGAGAGAGLVNGGETVHRGIEAAFVADIGSWLKSQSYSLEWDAGVTYADSRFGADRYVGSGANAVNIKGNKTPYAPSWFINSSLAFRHESGAMVCLTANHTGEQFTDILNTVEPSANGRIGLLASYTVFDANLAWNFSRIGTTVSISARNLTNERYIATRRPQGIRLGLPRMFTAGLKIDF